MENKSLKTVAIIGRPNVGKSTFFNRLVGKRVAIETPIAGTTRDRLFGVVNWQGHEFNLIDVAGIEKGTKSEISQNIKESVEIALDQADLVLFLVDWNEKSNEVDRTVAQELRRRKIPVILIINKADNIDRQKSIGEFQRLGNFPIFPVSAISGISTGDLLDEIIKTLSTIKPKPEALNLKGKFDLNLAIIGRPNVGKSTLLNTIIGSRRAIVSGEAGTTRDTIQVSFHHGGKSINLADTAGIRRPGKIGRDTIESFSLLRTERALKDSDIAVLLIDAVEGLVALDANILGKAKEWGKGVILAVNKIDSIENPEEFMDLTLRELQTKLNFVPWLPVVFISAQNDQNIKNLLDQVIKVYESRRTKISEHELAEILSEAKAANNQLKSLLSLKQKKTAPPIFEVAYASKKPPHFTQIRYLENKIRDYFPMNGTPVFLDLLSKRTDRKL